MYSPDGRLNPRISWLRGKTLCARATGKFNEINSALHTLNSPYRATAIYERTVRSRAHSQLHPFDPIPLSLPLPSSLSLSLRYLSGFSAAIFRANGSRREQRISFLMARVSVVETRSIVSTLSYACLDNLIKLLFLPNFLSF